MNKAAVRWMCSTRSFTVWGVPGRSLFLLTPSWTRCLVRFCLIGFSPLQQMVLLPGVTDIPWVSLLIYLVVFDLWIIGFTEASTILSGGGSCMRPPFSAADDDVDGQPQPFAG